MIAIDFGNDDELRAVVELARQLREEQDSHNWKWIRVCVDKGCGIAEYPVDDDAGRPVF